MLHSLRLWLYVQRQKRFRQKLLKKILNYTSSEEGRKYREEGEFIAKHGLSIFPYSFQFRYDPKQILLDYEEGYPFFSYRGKRLFLPNSMPEEKAKSYANSLLMEQDPESPHSYANAVYSIKSDDILLDIGCGDANFTLEHIDQVKKAFLYETDPKWKTPLQKTFQPWKEKVVLSHQRVGFGKNEANLSQMPQLESQSVLFKIDVDGAEREVLQMLDPLLPKLKKAKVAICTYHQNKDAEEFQGWFQSRGFRTAFQNRVILFHPDTRIQKPFFRPGVLFAYREEKQEEAEGKDKVSSIKYLVSGIKFLKDITNKPKHLLPGTLEESTLKPMLVSFVFKILSSSFA
ncbi:hypothetical protein [Algoriphagus taiwanensis]|uniref:Methyltransferase FkbM domain-containing protein n=1 Tax=Algoriphagus taiwanensis TaxID=1445656 RepID=A0ABQ6Q3W8_9BACT|nr:hypothetical protein Ataiwa_25920 [Algoriphagus taiwanensis]